MSGLATEKDRLFFSDLLVEIERRIDVNAITVDGVHLWPMIRLQLGRGLKTVAPPPQPESPPPAPVERPDGRTPPSVRSSVGGWLRRMLSAPGGDTGEAGAGSVDGASFPASAEERKQARRRHRADLKAAIGDAPAILEAQRERLRAVGPTDYVVLSKVEKYYHRVGEKRYAPITDPVYEDLRRRGRTLSLAQEPLQFACVHEPLRFDIEPHMLLTKTPERPEAARLPRQIDEINRLLAEIAPDHSLDPKQVVKRYDRYARKRAFFHDMFSILRPKAVFSSSYTGWVPMIWACRDLGIQTVDIQHGGQGPTHYPTTHWTRVPPNGYAFVPDFFWVWGEPIHRAIAPWLPGGAIRHVSVVGGNRNLAKWHRDRAEGRLGKRDRDFLKRMEGRDKVILVTLSYAVEELLPDCVVEAIKRTRDWTWLVRLHPIHRGTETRRQIIGRLRQARVRNFEIDEPTTLRLHTLLAASDHHVTPFSTACREAQAFGVATTFVHPLGGNFFAREIAEGVFAYADTAEDLLRGIRASADAAGARDPVKVIETDDKAVDRVLELVESAWERDGGGV